MIIHRGLESSQFAPISNFLQMVLKEVKCHCIWRVLKWVTVHQFPKFLWIILKWVKCCHMRRSWHESMCTNFLNSPKSSAAAIYEGSWKESMCTNSLIPPKWSWKESVCVATLLVALIPAVLSLLYSDVVLLYLWLFASTLAAWRTFSWAPWWTLLFCTPWGSLLCPWGSPWLLEITGTVCLPAAWLCIPRVGSLQSCKSCSS